MKDLEEEFIGRGSMKGFVFKQIEKSPYAYIYKVTDNENHSSWYEIFKKVIRKERDITMDGRNIHFDESVAYPTDESFGKTAWCSVDFDSALKLFKYINKKVKMRKKSDTAL